MFYPALSGVIRVGGAGSDSELLPVKWAAINATGIGDNTLVPGVAGKRIRVLFLWFSATLALSFQLKSGPNVKVDATAILASQPFVANGMPAGWVAESNPGEAFVLNLSLAANVRGALNYVEVS